ncbi:HEAT repeat domain-containing protein [Burkholderia sp. Bp8963]|nr:HEAT repeat domain-containing protein [Burkholderia sp. Bp8963]
MLRRIEIRACNGLEKIVAERVQERLAKRYGLKLTIVRDSLFRNLRGFISDISKQHGRSFGSEEFDYEVTAVWPEMVPLKAPLVLDPDHIRRLDITDVLVASASKVVEVVGVSGSGKSSLAAEAIERIEGNSKQALAYYVEVRNHTSFRDVLAGVTLRLRRYGAESAFGLAVDGSSSIEESVSAVAQNLSRLSRPVALFLDLVEGRCDTSFSHDLCAFVRKIISYDADLRIVVLGQERTLRDFSEFDRDALGIVQLDVRGFEFEELCRLAEARGSSIPRDMLWQIFGRATRGRPAGLIAARARSIADMSPQLALAMASSASVDEMIGKADCERFARISGMAIDAARKLVCFALPFSAAQAADAFPDDNVRQAIVEMLDLGLLRRYDDSAFEMHETVRAGLESGFALNVRRSAHSQLAEWYRSLEEIPAMVFHLDQAGRHNEARDVAKDTFMSGRYWSPLRDYVAKHELISGEEAVALFTIAESNGNSYLLPELFNVGSDSTVADAMLERLKTLPDEARADWSWTSNFIQAILRSAPGKLQSLLEYALEIPETQSGGDRMMRYVELAVTRTGVEVDQSCINLFNKQQVDGKRRLLRLFVASGRRQPLMVALTFLAQNYEFLTEVQRRALSELRLNVSTLERTREFLVALPQHNIAQMLVRKAALLDPLLGLIWAQRHSLRAHCVQLIEQLDPEVTVVHGAARVLIALGEPGLLKLCDSVRPQDNATRTLFQLLPALVPWLADRADYEARILDCNIALQDRLALVPTVHALGADLGAILEKLRAAEPESAKIWEFVMLGVASQSPFESGVPIVAEKLRSRESDPLLPSLVSSFGRLDNVAARELLLEAMHHSSIPVRMAAVNTLTHRRDPGTLDALVGRLDSESDHNLTQGIITAIVACHPSVDVAKRIDWSRFPSARIWRIVLASRLRNAAEAREIVDAATDVAQVWQLRRAAILAAARLRNHEIVEEIYHSVRDERSPFELDQTHNLVGHESALHLLTTGLPLFTRFLDEKSEFLSFIGGVFDAQQNAEIAMGNLPAGQQIADWLYCELVAHKYPLDQSGAIRLIDKLQVPTLHAALLHSLRVVGRFDLIEVEARSAYSLWYLIRCLIEFRHAVQGDPSVRERVRTIVASSQWASNGWLLNVTTEFFGGFDAQFNAASIGPSTSDAEARKRAFIDVSCSAATAALSGQIELDASLPLRLNVESRQTYTELVHELNPVNDYVRDAMPREASLRFTVDGYLVNDGRHPRKENNANLRARLRPAIAAANQWDTGIGWHDAALSDDRFGQYARQFLDCLLARCDAHVFYRELARHEGLLVPSIFGSKIHAENVKPLVDERMVPILSRYLGSGSDSLLLGLCTVAGYIEAPTVDSVLDGLFTRWLNRFEPGVQLVQHGENHELWIAFARLTKHPRFEHIRDWDIRLEALLATPMFDHHKNDVFRLLGRSPRSYRTLECQLFRYYSLAHWRRDKVEMLDDDVDRLFQC